MVKDAKPDHVWRKDLTAFARTKAAKMERGCHPRSGKWKVEYEKILKCPAHVGVVRINAFFGGGRKTISCNCSYHILQKNKPKVPGPSVSPPPNKSPPPDSPTESPVPEKVYSFGCRLPQVPEKLFSDDLKGKITWKRLPGYLDLFIFGPLTGVCPHCKSARIRSHGANTNLKLVWNYGMPYYCQGIDVMCEDCSGIIKSMDSRYVETLPRRHRLMMPFVQMGSGNGIDMKLIRMMRMGQACLPICEGATAMIHVEHQRLKAEYESRAEAALLTTSFDSYRPYPDFPVIWFPKVTPVIKGFLLDFRMNKHDLLREIQTITSKQALAIDHQRQVVKRVKQGHMKDDEKGTQSLIINGDHGLVLNYVVVPDTSEHWYGDALDEVCLRLGEECPKLLFVDCNCCHGNLMAEGETIAPPQEGEDGYRFWKSRLRKKLDGFHVCLRIGRQICAAHPRAITFTKHVANAIYIRDPVVEQNLQQARNQAGLQLTEKEIANDWTRYGKSAPGPSDVVADRLLMVLEAHRQLDIEARNAAIATGQDVTSLCMSDPAYPIVTRKVAKAIIQQAIHSINGCLDCDGELTHTLVQNCSYRNTGTMLPIYASPFGTSRCETFHSSVERFFHNMNVFSMAYFDARACWKVIHFNRKKLRRLGRVVPPHGMAPVEFVDTAIIPDGQHPPMLFGFDYCLKVLADRNEALYVDALKEVDLENYNVPDEIVSEQTDGYDDDDDSSIPSLKFEIDGGFPFNESTTESRVNVHERIRSQLRAVDEYPAVDRQKIRDKRTTPGTPTPTNTTTTTANNDNEDLGENALRQTIDQRRGKLSKVSLRINVAERRRQSGGLIYYPPDYNPDMQEVWQQLLADAIVKPTRITNELVDGLMRQYNLLEFTEQQKGVEARLLLPVSWHYANLWLKRTHSERNNLSQEGHTTDASRTIMEQLKTTLKNHNIQPTGVHTLEAAGKFAQANSAATLPKIQRADPVIRKRKKQQCTICSKFLGTGTDEHLKFNCPEMSEQMRQQKAERKRRLDAERITYEKESKRRKSVAKKNIANNKFPERLEAAMQAKAWQDAADRTCPVCGFHYKKNSNPDKDLNWHVVSYKRCQYCPFADPDETRNKLSADWRAKADKKNSVKRHKRRITQ